MSQKPYAFSVSATINAPAKKVFDVLNNFDEMNSWSPFVAMDKTMVATVSKPAVGPGSRYDWSGKRIGNGSMINREVVKPTKLIFDMEFRNKKTETALSEFLLDETDGVTVVTWALSGERGFGGQFMAAVLGLDNMMKKNFADGLSTLKRNIESAS